MNEDTKNLSKSKSSDNDKQGDKEDKTSGAKFVKITSLSPNVRECHLDDIFSAYGTIIEIHFVKHESGLPRCHAFLEFSSPEEARKAVRYMDGGQIDGMKIKVTAIEGFKRDKPTGIARELLQDRPRKLSYRKYGRRNQRRYRSNSRERRRHRSRNRNRRNNRRNTRPSRDRSRSRERHRRRSISRSSLSRSGSSGYSRSSYSSYNRKS